MDGQVLSETIGAGLRRPLNSYPPPSFSEFVRSFDIQRCFPRWRVVAEFSAYRHANVPHFARLAHTELVVNVMNSHFGFWQNS